MERLILSLAKMAAERLREHERRRKGAMYSAEQLRRGIFMLRQVAPKWRDASGDRENLRIQTLHAIVLLGEGGLFDQ